MKHEVELKIQGYLDNQLPAAERREIAELINLDSEAKSLHEALAATRTLLVGNEPEYKLPEAREFYWSKIEREIRKQAGTPTPDRTFALGLHNWWVRIAGALAAVVLLIVMVLSSSRLSTLVQGYHPAEVESPADMSAITFHSESANMTVVWVQHREDTN
jgi:anti-sigma factor RsiW